MNDFKDQRKGFTLIELLIVVGIIAVLASAVFVSVKGAREKAAIARGLHFSAQVDHALAVDIIAKWPFDEGEGNTVNDVSGGKRNGTIQGTLLWKDDNPAGKEGHSLEFDGNTSNYIEVSNLSSSLLQSGGTISVWVRFDGEGITDAGILDKYSGKYSTNGFYYDIDVNNKKVSFEINKGAGVFSENNSISIDNTKWQNLVVTYNSGGQVTHYINGVQSGAQGTTNAPDQITIDEPLKIGEDFKGLMTDVRIYGSPLSASQIQERYYAELEDLMARGIIE